MTTTGDEMNNEWIEQTIEISNIDQMLLDNYEIEVNSPDGWVGVTDYVYKGNWDEYCLSVDGYPKTFCNENHKFQTELGWVAAKNLIDKEFCVLTDSGFKRGVMAITGRTCPIVDIEVDHKNHRYYTNGISSHNTGVGKSLFMCHMAAANIAMGKNVLYITMEMAEEKIAERIDANLFDVDIASIDSLSQKNFESHIDKVRNKVNGKLIIKQYPTAGAHVGHFRALIDELRLKKDFIPDVIYIDYLNICASARMKNAGETYTYVKSIAEELRGLSIEKMVPIWTATQSNRSGYQNSDVDLSNTSESFGLPATADLYLALISNDELEDLEQILVKQLKNRYNDMSLYRRFVVGVDKSRMRLYDVEDVAQEDIMPEIKNITTNKTKKDNSAFSEFKFDD